MTPLAHRFAKRLTLPIKKREAVNETGPALAQIADIHCFECSELNELVSDWKGEDTERAGNTLRFLPAPKTWIEWKPIDSDVRRALLFVERNFEGFPGCDVFNYFGHHERPLSASHIGHLAYGSDDVFVVPLRDGDSGLIDRHYIFKGAMFIAMINTPRVIGRKQHMPNRGLERKLTKGFGVGKFPLHAWHEIKLNVLKPIEIDDGEPHEAHLTGRRALHFCRAHLRIRNGHVEFVTSHWRGDPALGIKQTRYRLTAEATT